MVLDALDLQAGLDVGTASMDDYAQRVVDAGAALPGPLGLCGWSMGGLVAAMAAGRARPSRVVLIEPSPPLEAQGRHPDIQDADGEYDGEAAYGRFPGVRSRPESARAQAQRLRGISVARLLCPSLVVYGDQYRESRGRSVAAHFGSAELDFPGLDHWGLVTRQEVRSAIAPYLMTENAGRNH